MDFRGRGTQSPTSSQPSGSTNGVQSASSQFNKLKKTPLSKVAKGGSLFLLFGIAALLLAVVFMVFTGGNNQAQAVIKDKYQAVFLNNGQVYFGKISAIGDKSIDLSNIYYLQTNGTGETAQAQSTSSNVSLVKLGCELHAPYDQMFINKDQVIFWENLTDESQVVKAINEYKKQNPKQQCSEQSANSTQQAPNTSTQQPAATPPATTPARP